MFTYYEHEGQFHVCEGDKPLFSTRMELIANNYCEENNERNVSRYSKLAKLRRNNRGAPLQRCA